VLSGEISAIDAAVDIAEEMGIRRALKLNVSGAFHSPLMALARPGLQAALSKFTLQEAKVPIYQNVSAQPVTDAQILRDDLLAQLEQPVLWEASIRQMASDGFTEFYEVGSGKVLQGLNRRIVPDAATTSVNSAAVLDHLNV